MAQITMLGHDGGPQMSAAGVQSLLTVRSTAYLLMMMGSG